MCSQYNGHVILFQYGGSHVINLSRLEPTWTEESAVHLTTPAVAVYTKNKITNIMILSGSPHLQFP